MHDRIPWKQYFMMQALVIAQRSTCNRALVGSVLVKDNRIIGTGYNGSVSGQPIHSEMNAIIQCAKFGVSTDGTEIYVTHFPCYNCCKSLLQAGIKKINYYFDYRDNPLAMKLLHDCGVPYEQIKIDRKYVEGLAHKLEEDEN